MKKMYALKQANPEAYRHSTKKWRTFGDERSTQAGLGGSSHSCVDKLSCVPKDRDVY